eukprot:365003-Chlamydomonas_euryale.AAC.3
MQGGSGGGLKRRPQGAFSHPAWDRFGGRFDVGGLPGEINPSYSAALSHLGRELAYRVAAVGDNPVARRFLPLPRSPRTGCGGVEASSSFRIAVTAARAAACSAQRAGARITLRRRRQALCGGTRDHPFVTSHNDGRGARRWHRLRRRAFVARGDGRYACRARANLHAGRHRGPP